MLLNDVTTLEEFMMWFANWASSHDHMRVFEEDNEKIFYVYDCTGAPRATYSTQAGLIFTGD